MVVVKHSAHYVEVNDLFWTFDAIELSNILGWLRSEEINFRYHVVRNGSFIFTDIAGATAFLLKYSSSQENFAA